MNPVAVVTADKAEAPFPQWFWMVFEKQRLCDNESEGGRGHTQRFVQCFSRAKRPYLTPLN